MNTILSFDPINHIALFEKYKWQNTDANKQQFVTTIKNEMPQETYAELATSYYNNGCTDEAMQLFQISPPSTEAILWLSFLQHKTADETTLNPRSTFLSGPKRPM